MHNSTPARRLQAQKAQSLSKKLLSNKILSNAEVIPVIKKLKNNYKLPNIEIINTTSEKIGPKYPDAAVLIFGSSKKPGGGYLNGAKAQEEDISLVSTWGEQASQTQGFYTYEKGLGGLGPDKILLAKGYWIENDDISTAVNLISVSAPNLQNSDTKNIPKAILIDHLARRLATTLITADSLNAPVIILGAIGCGVFHWDPLDSACALKLALQHYQPTAKIILAMPDPSLANIFLKILAPTPSSLKNIP